MQEENKRFNKELMEKIGFYVSGVASLVVIFWSWMGIYEKMDEIRSEISDVKERVCILETKQESMED